MRSASITPSLTSSSTSWWVCGKDVGILLADAGEIVDVEEAAVAPAHRIEVEEALAQGRVGPEAVAVVGGHVVGDDVEHEPETGGVGGLRQLPQRLLSPPRSEEMRVGSITS